MRSQEVTEGVSEVTGGLRGGLWGHRGHRGSLRTQGVTEDTGGHMGVKEVTGGHRGQGVSEVVSGVTALTSLEVCIGHTEQEDHISPGHVRAA
ncbi:unnamed protein product [Arctogadus glacialis]